MSGKAKLTSTFTSISLDVDNKSHTSISLDVDNKSHSCETPNKGLTKSAQADNPKEIHKNLRPETVKTTEQFHIHGFSEP